MSSSWSSLDITHEELLGLLSLNSMDYLKSYDGNPLTFHVFITSFDQIVEKITDPHHKLSHLLRFTSGDALHAVQGCAIIGCAIISMVETYWSPVLENKVSRSIIKWHIDQSVLYLPSAGSRNCLVSPLSRESRPYPQSSLHWPASQLAYLKEDLTIITLGTASSTVYCLIITS